MFTIVNPDDIDGAVPSTPHLIREYEAGRITPVFSASRERECAEDRRVRAISAVLWVLFFAVLAAAFAIDPCRPNGGVACSEVSH